MYQEKNQSNKDNLIPKFMKRDKVSDLGHSISFQETVLTHLKKAYAILDLILLKNHLSKMKKNLLQIIKAAP